MKRHPSSGARRLLRMAAIAAGGLLVLGVLLRFAAMDWFRRVEGDIVTAGAVGRDDDTRTSRLPDARRRLVARLALPRPPVTAQRASEAPDPPAANAPVTGSALAQDLEQLLAHSRDAPLLAYMDALSASTDDSGSVPLPEMRAWLDEHDAAIARVQDAVLAWEEAELRRALEGGSSDGSRLTRGRFVLPLSLARAVFLGRMISARAAVAATDGAQAEAERGCEALLRLHAMETITTHAAGLASRTISHGPVLRRVRPPDAADWIALMDSGVARKAFGPEALLGAVDPVPRGPYAIGRSYPLLDSLHEDLPRPLKRAVDGVILDPLAKVRWSLKTRRLLDGRAELEHGDECLPPVDADDLPEPVKIMRSAWRNVVVTQADTLVTREVLRLSLGTAAIEPASSPCPDWSVIVEELSDGRRRVRAAGSVLAHAPLRSWAPPQLDYAFSVQDR